VASSDGAPAAKPDPNHPSLKYMFSLFFFYFSVARSSPSPFLNRLNFFCFPAFWLYKSAHCWSIVYAQLPRKIDREIWILN
jgi:hypothetical protein